MLTKIIGRIRRDYDAYTWHCKAIGECVTAWGYIMDSIREFHAFYYCDWICRIWGHKLEDISIAGPDSGNIHLRCLRCGWEHEHALY